MIEVFELSWMEVLFLLTCQSQVVRVSILCTRRGFVNCSQIIKKMAHKSLESYEIDKF